MSHDCPVCGSARTAVHRDDVRDLEYFIDPRPPMEVRRCEACESQFLSPRPGAETIVSYYPPSYHTYNEDHGRVAGALVGVRARVRARKYRRFLEHGTKGRLFDVGAGDCRHFDELRRTCDIECAGVELNPDVASKGRARGYDIVDGTLEEMDLDGHIGRYDFVSMNHVLEHVIDPALVLARAFQLLKPGGHLLGQLPTVDSWEARLFGRRWGGYHYPRHLQMFSRSGLRHALEAAGFTDVKIRSALHLQTALSAQNALLGRRWHPTMRFGKMPGYQGLLLVTAPFEVAAYTFDRGGIINLAATRAA